MKRKIFDFFSWVMVGVLLVICVAGLIRLIADIFGLVGNIFGVGGF